MVDNPADELQRFEFLECIVRLAEAKYLKTNICTTYVTSIRKLLDEHILRMEEQDEWQEFRD